MGNEVGLTKEVLTTFMAEGWLLTRTSDINIGRPKTLYRKSPPTRVIRLKNFADRGNFTTRPKSQRARCLDELQAMPKCAMDNENHDIARGSDIKWAIPYEDSQVVRRPTWAFHIYSMNLAWFWWSFPKVMILEFQLWRDLSKVNVDYYVAMNGKVTKWKLNQRSVPFFNIFFERTLFTLCTSGRALEFRNFINTLCVDGSIG